MEARMHGWMMLSEALFKGADEGHEILRKSMQRRRPKRIGSYKTLRPGPYTPMWNQCRIALRNELKPYGSKIRLARYLGVSKQRMSDFLAGHRRMPDAELTLQMLNWLAAKRAGIDLSL